MAQQPELMVIGDSLAQGCRSLSVNKDFCAQSWGARIARSQGWPFVTPDMPRPILFDLEQEIRRLDLLSVPLAGLTIAGLVGRLVDNQNQWFASTPSDSQYPYFDNLGLAGALVCDLYQRTSANSLEEIDGLTNSRKTPLTNPQNIGDLHLAINGWFTLNPSHNPEWDHFTPLKWAEYRKPKRLMVQIGHNHGLFQFGFEAKDSPDPQAGLTQPGTAPFQQQPDDFWTQWSKLADGLAALPPDVETIVVVLLPKVGGVASLAPVSDNRSNGYADFYQPAFAPEPNVLPGSRVQVFDVTIRDNINKGIKDLLTNKVGARVKFLDTWAVFDSIDYKNYLGGQQISVGGGRVIDNRYLKGGLPFAAWLPGGLLVEGGFQSVDGMHPSGAGYAYLAEKVMELLNLPINPPPPGIRTTAFSDDKLLSQFPVQLDYLATALHLIRDAQHASDFVTDMSRPLTDQSHITEVIHAMSAVFHP